MSMPYAIKQTDEGYCVVKVGSNKVVACHDSAEKAKRQVSALYAAEPSLFAKALTTPSLMQKHNALHDMEMTAATITLHHTLVEEMRERNIQHENVDCRLHKAVIVLSKVLMDYDKALAILKGNPTSSDVHVDSIMPNGKKKKKKPILVDMEKGDKAGHQFRGNQHTKGGAGGGIDPSAQASADKATAIQAAGPTKFTSASDIANEKSAMGTATKDQAVQRAQKHDQDFQSHSQSSSDFMSQGSRAGNKREAYEADAKKYNTEAAISFNLAGAWTAQARSLGAKPSELTRQPRIGS